MEYNHSKDQTLMMDPLPFVNKVYSCVLKIEKQRMLNMVHSDDTDITTFRGGKIGPARWASQVHPELGPGWAIKLLA